MNELMGKLYQDGDVIVSQGEKGACMYVIQRGRVEIVRLDGGRELRVGLLEDGDFFGEMAIFEREQRSATARAVGEAYVLTVDRKTLLRRFKEDPTLAFHIMQTLCHRIRRLNGELTEATGGHGGEAVEQSA
jgi:CRP-like cAMP-binding protein